jgi:hypothetical protein
MILLHPLAGSERKVIHPLPLTKGMNGIKRRIHIYTSMDLKVVLDKLHKHNKIL